MKNNKIYNFFIYRLNTIFILEIIIYHVNNSTIEEAKAGLKEVAYAYYMRGKHIQYSGGKQEFFEPEDATSQKRNFFLCSYLARNIYKEFLNITLPSGSNPLVEYGKNHIGSPEVIAYSYISDKNISELKYYSPNEANKYKLIQNPTINDIIPLLQDGDVVAYSGHTQTIYDVEKDKNGKVIDAIIMESYQGKGLAHFKTKMGHLLQHFYSVDSFNSNYEDGLNEGSIGLNRFSKSKCWVNIKNINTREKGYVVLRFINSDSKGNAILNYNVSQKMPFSYNEIIELKGRSKDRIKFKRLYIEKLVNKNNNNIVELGDILDYKIIIHNRSKKDYVEDLIVTEFLSEFVTYESHYENTEIKSFNYDNNRTLTWNIGKLKNDSQIILNYLVKITNGKSNDIITSTGFVNNIPTSKIINTIGTNLNEDQKEVIQKNYEKLKKKYNGKKLL